MSQPTFDQLVQMAAAQGMTYEQLMQAMGSQPAPSVPKPKPTRSWSATSLVASGTPIKSITASSPSLIASGTPVRSITFTPAPKPAPIIAPPSPAAPSKRGLSASELAKHGMKGSGTPITSIISIPAPKTKPISLTASFLAPTLTPTSTKHPPKSIIESLRTPTTPSTKTFTITTGGIRRTVTIPVTPTKLASGIDPLAGLVGPTAVLSKSMVKGMGPSKVGVPLGLKIFSPISWVVPSVTKTLRPIAEKIGEVTEKIPLPIRAVVPTLAITGFHADVGVGFAKAGQSLTDPSALTASGALTGTGLHIATTGKLPSKSEFEKRLEKQGKKYIAEGYGEEDIEAWKKEELSKYRTHLERYAEDIKGREGELFGELVFDFMFGKYVVGPALEKVGGGIKTVGSKVIPESIKGPVSHSLKFGKPAKIGASIKSLGQKLKPWTTKKGKGGLAQQQVQTPVFDVGKKTYTWSPTRQAGIDLGWSLELTPKSSGITAPALLETATKTRVLPHLFSRGGLISIGVLKPTGFSKFDVGIHSPVGLQSAPQQIGIQVTKTTLQTMPHLPSSVITSAPSSIFGSIASSLGVIGPSAIRGLTAPKLSTPQLATPSAPKRKTSTPLLPSLPSIPITEPITEQKKTVKQGPLPRIPPLTILKEPTKQKQPSPLPRFPEVPTITESPKQKKKEAPIIKLPSIGGLTVPEPPKTPTIGRMPIFGKLTIPEPVQKQTPIQDLKQTPIIRQDPYQDQKLSRIQKLVFPSPTIPKLPASPVGYPAFFRNLGSTPFLRGKGKGKLFGVWIPRRHKVKTWQQQAETFGFGLGKPKAPKRTKKSRRRKRKR